jgi:hypothetical protein
MNAKNSPLLIQCFVFAAAFSFIQSGQCGESPAPAPANRSTKIIFSGTKTDTISTNYSETRSSLSPFQKLESELAKPFDLGDALPKPVYRPMRQLPQSPVAAPKRSWKEQQLEQAESRFLYPELGDIEDDNDLFDLPSHKTDPYKKRNPTALDRYYDRLDRDRQTLTNSHTETDLFGHHQDKSVRPEFGLDNRATNPLASPGLTNSRASNLGLYRSSLANDSPANNRSLFRESAATHNSSSALGLRQAAGNASRSEDYGRSWHQPGSPNAQSATRATSSFTPSDPYGATARRATWDPPKSPTASTSPNPGYSPAALSPRLTGEPMTPKAAPNYTTATTAAPRTPPATGPGHADPAKLPGFKIPQRNY